jgi:hypothetical protein
LNLRLRDKASRPKLRGSAFFAEISETGSVTSVLCYLRDGLNEIKHPGVPSSAPKSFESIFTMLTLNSQFSIMTISTFAGLGVKTPLGLARQKLNIQPIDNTEARWLCEESVRG